MQKLEIADWISKCKTYKMGEERKAKMSILDIIFPRVCGFCGKLDNSYLCEECKKKIQKELVCKTEKVKYKHFEKLIYILNYEGEIRNKILSYKFKDKSYMYKTFAKIILENEKICKIIKMCDIIIPVPIHKKRKDERGYNQSELIAKEIAIGLKITYAKLLRKIKNNKKQSSLKRKERIENVKNVYEVINKEIIYGRNIILFDDIYTTGATVQECSRMLKENGANYIFVLSLAKVTKEINKINGGTNGRIS